jgi:peptide/nickel transport system substrate-binding protein
MALYASCRLTALRGPARPFVYCLLLALLVLSVSACGRKGTTAASRPSHPLPEEPLAFTGAPGVYGGRVVVTTLGPPKTFNPMLSNESSTNDIIGNIVFEGLTGYDNQKQEVTPGLAASWDTSPDGRVWTFHLRKGIRWSDGAPITVDDVMFTSQVMLDSTLHPTVVDLVKVDGQPPVFEKVDDSTIKVTLPSSYGPFIHVISAMRILPRHKLLDEYAAGKFDESWGIDTPPDSIVSSGAFRIASYVPNEMVVLKPNPWYYAVDSKKQRLPYIDELIWRIVPDQNAEVVTFKSGESDAFFVRAEDYKSMKDGEAVGNYTVHDLGMEFGTNLIWFNLKEGKNEKGRPFVDPVKQAWFRNQKFRQAIAHAIDRETIIRNVYYGQAEPLYGPIPSANRLWYNEAIHKYPYDIEKGKALLAEAGFKDTNGDGILEDPKGNKVSFTMGTNSSNKERVATGTILVEDFRKLGIELHFTPMEFNAITTAVSKTYDYEAMMLGGTGGVPPDPVMMVSTFKSHGRMHFWNPNQEKPATEWEARIDSLVDAQMKLNELAQRKPYIDEVQDIYAEQVPAIYTVSKKGFVAIRNRLKNTRPSIFRPWAVWNADEIYVDPKAGAKDTASR